MKAESHLGQSVLSGTGQVAIYAAAYLMLLAIATAADASSIPHLEKRLGTIGPEKYYGQNLADHGRRDRHRFLCSRDRGLRRRDHGFLHAHHGPDSGDHGFCEAEYLLDQGDHFPGCQENGLRL